MAGSDKPAGAARNAQDAGKAHDAHDAQVGLNEHDALAARDAQVPGVGQPNGPEQPAGPEEPSLSVERSGTGQPAGGWCSVPSGYPGFSGQPGQGGADLLIIGGGIVGLTAAIAAAGLGARVLVVDAAFNAGSGANAGSLHVQLQSRFIRLYPDQAPNVEASLPLYLQAVVEWDRLEAAFGPFEMVRKGGLMLAEDTCQLRFLEVKAAREAARGLDVAILDRAELDRIAPWLGPQIVGAELCRDEGKLNPLIANKRLRAEAVRRGVTFHRDRIVALSVAGQMAGGVVATGAAGDVYSADQAIIAAAWGAGALVAGLGLRLPSRAEPLHMNITEPGEVRINHLIQHAERSVTLKQFGSGQIVIGGGWPAASHGNHAVPEVLASSMLGNVALAARLVPGIADLRVLRTWAGMNTTVDGKTVLGRLPGAARVIVAVPGDAGYTLGPLCGRMAAEMAGGLDIETDPAPFSPARFTS